MLSFQTCLVNSHEDSLKTLHQSWFHEPLLTFLKLEKFLSTSLNVIFVSYHPSNLMKVEQVLMVTTKLLSHKFFPLKKGTKDCQAGHTKQAAAAFPMDLWIFFFPIQIQMFTFSVLQFFRRISLVILCICGDFLFIY